MSILPKVILHEHLEGSVTPKMARQLADKYKITLPPDFFYPENAIDSSQFPHGRYYYDETDFTQFISTYDRVASLIKAPEDYYLITHDFLARNAEQGLMYCEFLLSPYHMCVTENDTARYWDDARYLAIMNEIERAIKEVQVHHHLVVRLHAVGVRHLGADIVEETLRFIERHPHPLITGFNLAGNESAGNFADFVATHQLADALHMQKSYHAGEICASGSIRDALAHGAVRIGHGIQAISDEALLDTLIQQSITLEISLTSNRILVTDLAGKIENHPIRKLYDRGVRVTLNTDDAGIFGTDIAKEYAIASDIFHFNRTELLDITLCALEAAFLDKAIKQSLITDVYQQFSCEDIEQLTINAQQAKSPALKARLNDRLAAIHSLN